MLSSTYKYIYTTLSASASISFYWGTSLLQIISYSKTLFAFVILEYAWLHLKEKAKTLKEQRFLIYLQMW